MQFTWFDHAWPWIGLAISAAMLALLFGADLFRSDTAKSRWHDPVWLAWLAPAAYMLHQTEEYGVTLFGRRFAFPDTLCAANSLPPYPDCIIPAATYVGINIPVIWVLGLICGLLAWRHPLMGLGVYGVHSTNWIAHIGDLLATGHYNPGVFTAFLIQLPISLWVIHATWRNPRIRISGLATIFVAGIIYTAVLLGSVKAFVAGQISGNTLVAIQVLNPLWFLLFTGLKERRDRRGHLQGNSPIASV